MRGQSCRLRGIAMAPRWRLTFPEGCCRLTASGRLSCQRFAAERGARFAAERDICSRNPPGGPKSGSCWPDGDPAIRIDHQSSRTSGDCVYGTAKRACEGARFAAERDICSRNPPGGPKSGSCWPDGDPAIKADPIIGGHSDPRQRRNKSKATNPIAATAKTVRYRSARRALR
jgi:hypothetical protein